MSRITVEGIKKRLPACLQNIDIETYPTLDSTNTLCAHRITEGCREWHTVITASQTAGQGRLGRSFYSPEGTGIYMSCVLYPERENKDASLITGCAAVAAAEAIEEVFGAHADIKWVNDIFINNRKVAGILAKGAFSKETGHSVILGIGVNVYPPKDGFPHDIKDIAGCVTDKRCEDGRERLCAALISGFKKAYDNLTDFEYVKKYKSRCITIGKNVTVHPAGRGEIIEALAIDIDSKFHIKVRYNDGTEDTLSSGEVSVRI